MLSLQLTLPYHDLGFPDFVTVMRSAMIRNTGPRLNNSAAKNCIFRAGAQRTTRAPDVPQLYSAEQQVAVEGRARSSDEVGGWKSSLT